MHTPRPSSRGRARREMALAVSVYRLLIRAYPLRFSDQYSEEMVRLFSDQLKAAELEGRVARLWIQTISDWLRSVRAEHASELRRRWSDQRFTRPGSIRSTGTALRRLLLFAPNVPVALILLAGILGYQAVRKLRS